MRDPLLLPALGFMGGIGAARWAGFNTAEGWLLAGVAAAGLAIGLRKDAGRAAGLCLLLLFAGLGMVRLASAPALEPPRLNVDMGERAILRGCVVEPAIRVGDRMRFLLEISGGARVRVSAPFRAPAPAYGERLEGEAVLQEPSEFRNPGAFSFREWLARRATFWVAVVPNEAEWRRAGGECGASWRAWIYRTRARLLDRLDGLYGKDRYHAAMMRGLLLGDSSAIERVWVEDFRRTGTYHALVISGGHVAFFTGLFLIWVRFCRFGWHGVMILAAISAWLYALLAGGDAPVIRSAAGFTLYVASRFVYRRARLLNLLSLVALLFLAEDPQQLFEASFQLSFLAVAAIAALAEPLTLLHLKPLGLLAAWLRKPEPGQKVLPDPEQAARLVELKLIARTIAATTGAGEPRVRSLMAHGLRTVHWLGGSLLVSGCVQLALALPMILYFHRVSWTGLTANLLVTPLVTFAVPFGFGAIATGWGWCAAMAGWLLDAARWLAALHADWEFVFRVPDPPAWAVLALAGCTALWALLIRRNSAGQAPVFLLLCALLGVITVAPFPSGIRRGALELTAIDVGTGDSLFVGLPDGSGVLVDSGGLPARPGAPPRIDTGEDVVSPYLWSRGIRRLEAIALTHLDNDHSGGMVALLRNFRPKEFWIGSIPDNERARRILGAAREAGARVIRMSAGRRLSAGGAVWEVISAADPGTVRENDSSLVLRVTYGRQSMLLTGDLERAGERMLLAAGGLPPAAILKVSHHGSRTGTTPEFLEAIRPAVAIISTGRRNTYGFPHETVLRNLAGRRILALRTDLAGSVSVRTDGRGWEHLPSGRVAATRANVFGPAE